MAIPEELMQRALARWLCVVSSVMVLLTPLNAISTDKTTAPKKEEKKTYRQDETLKEAEAFFGKGSEGLSKVIAKAFKEQGEPTGFIKGEEASGAIGVGLRYGHGDLQVRGGVSQKVFWQGPSIGFDLGGNASKVFVLVYKLNDAEKLFQRFPGVDGSLYFVGGVGLCYLRTDGITLAPVRLGVGWRQGASVGYMRFTKKKTWNPF
jgi:hypothetical protein